MVEQYGEVENPLLVKGRLLAVLSYMAMNAFIKESKLFINERFELYNNLNSFR
tara:strand:- start:44 stop:202 length:159 start_codon:yes stop_codon:yes gene_type:complete